MLLFLLLYNYYYWEYNFYNGINFRLTSYIDLYFPLISELAFGELFAESLSSSLFWLLHLFKVIYLKKFDFWKNFLLSFSKNSLSIKTISMFF